MLNCLHFSSCNDLKWIGALGGPQPQSQPLPLACLSSLYISRCPNFVSFEIEKGLSATSLTSLELHSCVNLKSLPEHMHSLLPSLELLDISHCPKMESFPREGLPSKLKYIFIKRSEKLIAGMMRRKRRGEWSLQTLPSLTRFVIDSAELKIGSFPDKYLLPSSLTSLEIRGLPNPKLLNGEGFQHLTALRQLVINGPSNDQSMTASDEHSILPEPFNGNCFQHLTSLPELSINANAPSNDESMMPQSLTVTDGAQWNNSFLDELSNPVFDSFELAMRALTNPDDFLPELNINANSPSDDEAMMPQSLTDSDTFPDEYLLPTSLTDLQICDFPNLRLLEDNVFQHLTSLTNLCIKKCPELQSMPAKTLPDSLSYIFISECPSLSKRWKKGKGKDWPIISRIPVIQIDDELII